MKVEVFGDGCPKCRKMEENVRRSVEEAELEAEIEVVSDPERIARHNLLTLPGLAVDGRLLVAGKLLSPSEIATLLADPA